MGNHGNNQYQYMECPNNMGGRDAPSDNSKNGEVQSDSIRNTRNTLETIRGCTDLFQGNTKSPNKLENL